MHARRRSAVKVSRNNLKPKQANATCTSVLDKVMERITKTKDGTFHEHKLHNDITLLRAQQAAGQISRGFRQDSPSQPAAAVSRASFAPRTEGELPGDGGKHTGWPDNSDHRRLYGRLAWRGHEKESDTADKVGSGRRPHDGGGVVFRRPGRSM